MFLVKPPSFYTYYRTLSCHEVSDWEFCARERQDVRPSRLIGVLDSDGGPEQLVDFSLVLDWTSRRRSEWLRRDSGWMERGQRSSAAPRLGQDAETNKLLQGPMPVLQYQFVVHPWDISGPREVFSSVFLEGFLFRTVVQSMTSDLSALSKWLFSTTKIFSNRRHESKDSISNVSSMMFFYNYLKTFFILFMNNNEHDEYWKNFNFSEGLFFNYWSYLATFYDVKKKYFNKNIIYTSDLLSFCWVSHCHVLH